MRIAVIGADGSAGRRVVRGGPGEGRERHDVHYAWRPPGGMRTRDLSVLGPRAEPFILPGPGPPTNR
jgi:hypothetical protein